MKTTIKQRLQNSEEKAKPLINKYDKMSFEERIKFIKNNRFQFKRDMNIINRFYNLIAREQGFAIGIKQFKKELK